MRNTKNVRTFLLIILTIPLALSACGPTSAAPAGQAQTETANAIEAASLPTSTTAPTDTAVPPTPTEEPSPTPLPTATLPPTATPVPPLAVLPDGFSAWCAPLDYAGTQSEGPTAPDYARKLTRPGGQYVVSIPAVHCTLAFRFNQPAPNGLELRLLDGKNAFLKQPLTPATGQPDVVWTSVTHQFVVNPPFWEVTYGMVVAGVDGAELWNNPVKFAKPLPEPCPYGGLPDPVTLYCAVTDPWEIEPWPDVTPPYRRPTSDPDD